MYARPMSPQNHRPLAPEQPQGRETKPGSDSLAQAQAALTESEARFRATFEQAPVGIVHGDLRGAVRLANRRVRELFGYEESEFLGLRLWQCTHPDDLWTVERFKKLLSGEINDYTLEKRYLRRDGHVWWARVNVSMARDDEGRPKYFIVIVEDISQRKQAEEHLERARQELEAKVVERTAELEEANTALKVLLDRREAEQRQIGQRVVASARQLVLPFLERLAKSGLSGRQRVLAEAVRSGLEEITASAGGGVEARLERLTPRELEVAHLVADGRSTSQIADALGLSDNAVGFHRRNIRGKLGLTNRKINLHSHLKSLAR